MKRALLIGINDYPLGNELHGCLEDVSNLLTALSRNGDGTKNFDIKALTNIQDSADARQNIEQLFHDDADIALFYFSGHGYIDANGGQLVFPNDLMSYAANPSAKIGIQMSEIMDIANSSHVKNKIIILDCCHAGDIGKDHVDHRNDDGAGHVYGKKVFMPCDIGDENFEGIIVIVFLHFLPRCLRICPAGPRPARRSGYCIHCRRVP